METASAQARACEDHELSVRTAPSRAASGPLPLRNNSLPRPACHQPLAAASWVLLPHYYCSTFGDTRTRLIHGSIHRNKHFFPSLTHHPTKHKPNGLSKMASLGTAHRLSRHDKWFHTRHPEQPGFGELRGQSHTKKE